MQNVPNTEWQLGAHLHLHLCFRPRTQFPGTYLVMGPSVSRPATIAVELASHHNELNWFASENLRNPGETHYEFCPQLSHRAAAMHCDVLVHQPGGHKGHHLPLARRQQLVALSHLRDLRGLLTSVLVRANATATASNRSSFCNGFVRSRRRQSSWPSPTWQRRYSRSLR